MESSTLLLWDMGAVKAEVVKEIPGGGGQARWKGMNGWFEFWASQSKMQRTVKECSNCVEAFNFHLMIVVQHAS